MTQAEKQKDIEKHTNEGYKVVKEGAASFDSSVIKNSLVYKAGEIYIYVEYERVIL